MKLRKITKNIKASAGTIMGIVVSFIVVGIGFYIFNSIVSSLDENVAGATSSDYPVSTILNIVPVLLIVAGIAAVVGFFYNTVSDIPTREYETETERILRVRRENLAKARAKAAEKRKKEAEAKKKKEEQLRLEKKRKYEKYHKDGRTSRMVKAAQILDGEG